MSTRFVSNSHKECSSCGEVKANDAFHKDKSNKKGNGYAYYCKACAMSKAREWHHANKTSEAYIKGRRNRWTKIAHGIGLDTYLKKLFEQGLNCAICNKELKTSGYGTHLDHCHKMGKHRGFLCSNCNRGLGLFQDNEDFLAYAIEYLQKHKEQ